MEMDRRGAIERRWVGKSLSSQIFKRGNACGEANREKIALSSWGGLYAPKCSTQFSVNYSLLLSDVAPLSFTRQKIRDCCHWEY